MIPQFVLLANARRAHKSVICYITAHTVYKCLHIIHWIYHYYQQKTLDEMLTSNSIIHSLVYQQDAIDKISASSSIIQSLLYLDFFVNIWVHLKMPVCNERRSPPYETIEANFYSPEEQLTEVKSKNFCEDNGYLSLNMNVVKLDPLSLGSKDNNNDLHKTKQEL